ncbi:hypothetical protein ACJJWD_13265 [Comamonas testosteroni]|uniref:hypothetical protein n=1 Tax=Comamonas testosteroni TaxID=285 RepID=UPI00389AA356
MNFKLLSQFITAHRLQRPFGFEGSTVLASRFDIKKILQVRPAVGLLLRQEISLRQLFKTVIVDFTYSLFLCLRLASD